MKAANELAEARAQENLQILEAGLLAEKSKMEESEAKFNMQLVSLTENLSLNKIDLTATQEKLMDVVKHNDELRGFNIGKGLLTLDLCYTHFDTRDHIESKFLFMTMVVINRLV